MIKKVLIKSKVVTLLLCFILCSCTPSSDVVFHTFKSVNPSGWLKYDSLTYTIPIHKKEDLIYELELRHLAHYKYKDLILSLTHNFNDSTHWQSDTLSISLADNEGRWIGIGLGSIFQIEDTLYIKKSQQPGNYTLKITQLMNDNFIKGIHDIGLRITPLHPANP